MTEVYAGQEQGKTISYNPGGVDSEMSHEIIEEQIFSKLNPFFFFSSHIIKVLS